MTALLYGVGVGPGDPELLTLKAARLIESADVIFCPRGAGRPGRALTAAARHLDGKRVVQLEMEMRGDRDGALVIAAQTLAAELAQGCGVYLTEGDPSLFSTFQLLVATLVRVAPRVRVEVVPGVSSVLAAAAAAGISLGLADQTLAILPASAPLGLIEDVLSGFDQTVLLKPSMGGDQLPALLRRLGRLEASTLVAEASAAEQEVLRGEAAADGTRPYFSTWLVPGGPPRGAPGRVHFIGAGPGSAAHLTRHAQHLIRWADLVVAADSLVTPEVIGLARPGARVIETSKLTLEEAVPPMIEAARNNQVVVRLHSGDPSIYGAVAEQLALLRAADCPYEIVPGVSAAFAVAAALGVELTQAGGAQTVIFTRHGNRVPTPPSERLAKLAATRSTLAIFLSANAAAEVQSELEVAGLDPSTPAAIAYQVSWPDERIVRTTVGEIASEIRRLGLRRHTLILVGEAIGDHGNRSRLYDSAHAHVYRGRGQSSAPELATPPVLIAVTGPGARLARRLARSLPGARLVVADKLVEEGETALGRASLAIPSLFATGAPMVLFMAVGAAVRLLGPALKDKATEPPVVVVDDGGRYAVSLLGGRAAGANRLADWVARVLGTQSIVTTAAESLGLPPLDEIFRELGWRPAAGYSLTGVEAAIVNGTSVGFFAPGIEVPAGIALQRVKSLAAASRFEVGLSVTDEIGDGLPPGWITIRPRRLRLGLGCSTQATPKEALDAVQAALALAGRSGEGVLQVATIDLRADHPAVLAVAAELGAELVTISAADLEAVSVPNPSEVVRAAVGTSSVAEAAALLAAAGGRLILLKQALGPVTVAIAEVN